MSCIHRGRSESCFGKAVTCMRAIRPLTSHAGFEFEPSKAATSPTTGDPGQETPYSLRRTALGCVKYGVSQISNETSPLYENRSAAFHVSSFGKYGTARQTHPPVSSCMHEGNGSFFSNRSGHQTTRCAGSRPSGQPKAGGIHALFAAQHSPAWNSRA